MGSIFKGVKTLFFIADYVPSEEELDEAKELSLTGHEVMFRNVNLIGDEGTLETFEKVAGLVPDRYAKQAEKMAEEVAEDVLRRQALAASENAPAEGGTGVVAPVTSRGSKEPVDPPPVPGAKPAPAAEWKPNA